MFCVLLISKQVRAAEQFPLGLTSVQPRRLVSRGCWERGAPAVPSPGDSSHLRCLPSAVCISRTWHSQLRGMEDSSVWVLEILANESTPLQSLLHKDSVPNKDKSRWFISRRSQKEPSGILGGVTSCVKPSEWFNLSEPQFPYLSNEEKKRTCLTDSWKGSGSRREVPAQQRELVSAGQVLETQIFFFFSSDARHTESATLEWGPGDPCSNQSSREFDLP